jgi:hypothetical protein
MQPVIVDRVRRQELCGEDIIVVVGLPLAYFLLVLFSGLVLLAGRDFFYERYTVLV